MTLYQSTLSIFYYNFCLLNEPIKQDPTPDQFSLITLIGPYPRVNGLKSIPFHWHVYPYTNIWEYPPRGKIRPTRNVCLVLPSRFCACQHTLHEYIASTTLWDLRSVFYQEDFKILNRVPPTGNVRVSSSHKHLPPLGKLNFNMSSEG